MSTFLIENFFYLRHYCRMQKDKIVQSAILRALKALDAPAGATVLASFLQAEGLALKPRAIRMHLLKLDQAGLTAQVSRRHGRKLTARGQQELEHGNVIEKIGFIAAKVDLLGYRMSFNLDNGKGSVIANTAILPRNYLVRAVEEMKHVFAAGLGMGDRIVVNPYSGEKADAQRRGATQVSIATVCSVTVNGILLKAGIPTISRFGGLLEMREGRPRRFVELIEYSGTTLDPLDIFIHAGMTSVRKCSRTGSGMVGASFREIPSPAIPAVEKLRKQMTQLGLRGILALGRANQPLMGIPVTEGRAGMIVMAGINPFAALIECGAKIKLSSLAQLTDYRLFTPLHEWRRKYGDN